MRQARSPDLWQHLVTVFLYTLITGVFISLTMSSVVEGGFTVISISIFLSILSEINRFLSVHLFSTQWVTLYYFIILRIVVQRTFERLESVVYLSSFLCASTILIFRFLSISVPTRHVCTMNELSRYMALKYCLIHYIFECYRISSMLFHIQNVFVSKIKQITLQMP